MSIMLNIWLLVEFQSYAMTAKVTNHGATVLVCIVGNGISQIAHKDVRLRAHLLANLQTLPSNVNQAFTLGCCLANDEHTAGIGIIAIQDGGTIHVDDVTLLQNVVFRGDAVANHIVDAGAAGIGVTLVGIPPCEVVKSYTSLSISRVLIPSRIRSATQSNTAVFSSPALRMP